MKHLLLTTIAAVLLVECGESQPPEPSTAKAPDISIHEAANEGNIEAVKQRIADGVDVNVKNRVGETPLDFAINKNRTETADLLREHGGKTGGELNVLLDAAKKGGIEAVKQNLAAGADVNAKDDGGMAPLHYAARDGQKEIAELLIAKGAGVNAKANDGTTPRDWAVAWDEPETAGLLRKHGGRTGEELKAEGK